MSTAFHPSTAHDAPFLILGMLKKGASPEEVEAFLEVPYWEARYSEHLETFVITCSLLRKSKDQGQQWCSIVSSSWALSPFVSASWLLSGSWALTPYTERLSRTVIDEIENAVTHINMKFDREKKP